MLIEGSQAEENINESISYSAKLDSYSQKSQSVNKFGITSEHLSQMKSNA
jgi:hypothetical protein